MSVTRIKERLDGWTLAARVAKEIPDQAIVNLGVGLPAYVSDVIPEDKTIHLQSENGLLNYGGIILDADRDQWDVIDASGNCVGLLPGASVFHSADCFALIRGGHLDYAVLGALQVSEKGDLANWFFPQKGFGNIGGGMDVATGARHLFVAMEHVTSDGDLKILKECTYPITAVQVVEMIFTDLAVIEVTPQGLVLKEHAPGWSAEEIQALTGPKLIIASDFKEIEL